MRIFRLSRLFFLALLFSIVPASSFAGVFISVGFAPPALPVYVQPPCPEPGMMWVPGYWAYGPDGYYWVPGTWAPAPYAGALWTPPYWGWSGGLYVFHTGYWGPHVGYYGGVNYGFGYMGIGFVGGMWHGRDFEYNTAVMNVNRTVIHNTYIDRTVVERNTIVNDRHVAYSGGPGGIRHDPMPQERMASHDQHMQPTQFQRQHIQAAQGDRSLYARNNGGMPSQMATARPLQMDRNGGQQTAQNQARPFGQQQNQQFGSRTSQGGGSQFQNRPQQQYRPAQQSEYRQTPQQQYRPQRQNRPVPQQRFAPHPVPRNNEHR